MGVYFCIAHHIGDQAVFIWLMARVPESGPDSRWIAGIAEAGGHRSAADAREPRSKSVYCLDGILERRHHRRIRGGRRRGLDLFDGRDFFGNAKTGFDLVRQATDRFEDLIERVAGKDPAVGVEDVLSGNGVDIGYIGIFSGRLKGALRGLEEGIKQGKYLVKPLKFHDEMRSGQEGVFPQRRPAAVALAAGRLEAEPEHAFFRDLDEISLLIARVRADDKVRLPEGVGGGG